MILLLQKKLLLLVISTSYLLRFVSGQASEIIENPSNLIIVSPPGDDESVTCWNNTRGIQIHENINYPLGNLTATSQPRRYVLCPNTIYEIELIDQDGNIQSGDNLPLNIRPYIQFFCGEDGKSSNNCVLTSGQFGIHALVLDLTVDPLKFEFMNNVLVSGITFEKQFNFASYNTLPGNILYRDCVFKDQKNFSPVYMRWHPNFVFDPQPDSRRRLSEDKLTGYEKKNEDDGGLKNYLNYVQKRDRELAAKFKTSAATGSQHSAGIQTHRRQQELPPARLVVREDIQVITFDSCTFSNNRNVVLDDKSQTLLHVFTASVIVSAGEPDDGPLASENSPDIAQHLYVTNSLFNDNVYNDTSSYLKPTRHIGSVIWSEYTKLVLEDNCFIDNHLRNTSVYVAVHDSDHENYESSSGNYGSGNIIGNKECPFIYEVLYEGDVPVDVNGNEPPIIGTRTCLDFEVDTCSINGDTLPPAPSSQPTSRATNCLSPLNIFLSVLLLLSVTTMIISICN